MELDILVSVIVPIYNVEKYLEQCCRSVFEQTYSNCEYIFVDDYSKDKSMKILERLIEEYGYLKDRINIVHHDENMGVAVARRSGIEKATGEYVLFVDSDDVPEKCMVENLVGIANETNADAVICGYYIDVKRDVDVVIRKIDNLECLKHVLSIDFVFLFLWNKLLRRSYFVEYDFFPSAEYRRSEDFYMMYHFFYYAKNIFITNQQLYYYRLNEQSISHVWKSNMDTVQAFTTVKDMDDFFDNVGLHDTVVLQSANRYRLTVLKEISLYGDVGVLHKNKSLVENINFSSLLSLMKRDWPAALVGVLWKLHMSFLVEIVRLVWNGGVSSVWTQILLAKMNNKRSRRE